MAHAMLSFNEQIERIGEVVAVIAVGMLLWAVEWQRASWCVRRLAAARRSGRSRCSSAWRARRRSASQRGLIGWFGIRGIGSLYYLTYAMNHGLAPELAATLVALVLSVVVVSIVVHGISVTPLMTSTSAASRASRKTA